MTEVKQLDLSFPALICTRWETKITQWLKYNLFETALLKQKKKNKIEISGRDTYFTLIVTDLDTKYRYYTSL